MGLNPKMNAKTDADWISELFHPGQSPYFAMFEAGKLGIDLGELALALQAMGIPIREKDVRNWENGMFARQVGREVVVERRAIAEDVKFDSLPKLPLGWRGTEHRFFPCTADNRPMQKWGWSRDFRPNLMPYTDARVLSPVGWVGQNMLYQPFIVLDIDGVGHGGRDDQVIEFGNRLRNRTLCMEDPAKPGSFHLYLSTDRLVPVRHYPWAKLDFMGNAVNAAVYMKNKVSNGLPMARLDGDIWNMVDDYQKSRKEQLCL